VWRGRTPTLGRRVIRARIRALWPVRAARAERRVIGEGTSAGSGPMTGLPAVPWHVTRMDVGRPRNGIATVWRPSPSPHPLFLGAHTSPYKGIVDLAHPARRATPSTVLNGVCNTHDRALVSHSDPGRTSRGQDRHAYAKAGRAGRRPRETDTLNGYLLADDVRMGVV
jgi:hypothetical protein